MSEQILITNEKNAILQGRKEVLCSIAFEKGATLKQGDVMRLVAEKMKQDEKLVKVKHIRQLFGERKVNVVAYVYQDEATLKRFETINKKKKEKKAEQKPAEKKEK